MIIKYLFKYLYSQETNILLSKCFCVTFENEVKSYAKIGEVEMINKTLDRFLILTILAVILCLLCCGAASAVKDVDGKVVYENVKEIKKDYGYTWSSDYWKDKYNTRVYYDYCLKADGKVHKVKITDKCVKVKTKFKKKVNLDKTGLKQIKKRGHTDSNVRYGKLHTSNWKVLKAKKCTRYYTDYKYVKSGYKYKWVKKSFKSYESWVDSYGNLYKTRYWDTYKKAHKNGRQAKYLGSNWKHYSDGDIGWAIYKVRVKVPAYKTVKVREKYSFYKVKLQQYKYKSKITVKFLN